MKKLDIIEHILKSGEFDEFKCEVHGIYLIRKDIPNKSCPYKKYHEKENDNEKKN